MRGKLVAVREDPIGTELSADASLGDVTIDVVDLDPIDWHGGAVLIGGFTGEGHAYDVVGAPDPNDDAIDLEEDPEVDGGTLNLHSPLIADYVEGDSVWLYPPVYEKVAYVILDNQREVLRCRIADQLYDRLSTDSRAKADRETVEVFKEDDEHVVRDLVGELGPGALQGYEERLGSFAVTGTSGAPDVTVTVPVDVPSVKHRVVFWASAQLNADLGVKLKVGFDDDGFDFNPGEFPLASFWGGGDDGSNTFTGPAYVAPALPLINLAHSGLLPLPNGLQTGNVQSQYFPTMIAPYNEKPPTPGLHMFRLTAWIDAGAGDASIEDARFWVGVL